MKRFAFIAVFVLIIIISGFSSRPLAADGESPAYLLYQQWEQGGYPDDIGGVYSVDGSLYRCAFLVVDPTPERIEELHVLAGADVVIVPCKYSYKELRRVQDEINIEMGTDSKIYSSGIGFAGTDDVVNGFAESGKDFRVVVSVDESEFARYSAEFKEKFDDRVILEIGDPIFLDYGDGINNEQIVGTIDLVETGNRNGYLWILLLLVIGLPVMLILTRLRRKKVRPKEKISIEEQDLSRIHQV